MKGLSSTSLYLDKKLAFALKKIQENRFNAYIDALPDRAKQQLDSIRQMHDEDSDVLGWTIAVKDNIAISDQRLTCGSKILAEYVSPYSATVIEKLDKAGALIIARTNMDEFGMGSASRFSAMGPVKHPLGPGYSPGGSSGGSAVAVSCGDVRAALGSDTGGSVRQPAAYCGISGFRPTYGAISRFGLVAFSSSLDQIGPMAGTVKDVATLFRVCRSHETRDMTSRSYDHSGLHDISSKKPGRLFTIQNFGQFIRSTAILDTLDKAKRCLKFDQGFLEGQLELPHLETILAAYHVTAAAEAVSNLARFDGVRYQPTVNSESNSEFFDAIGTFRGKSFGKEVKRRLLVGSAVLSHGFSRNLYGQAIEVRRKLKQQLVDALKERNLIILPVTPGLSNQAPCETDDLVAMYKEDIFTVLASLADCPALTVPLPVQGEDLPVSIQLIGAPFQDEYVLEIGRKLEAIW